VGGLLVLTNTKNVHSDVSLARVIDKKNEQILLLKFNAMYYKRISSRTKFSRGEGKSEALRL
jgi:hypothetical protein